MPDSVTLRDSAGRAYGVPQEQVASYISQGFRPETDEEGINRTASETFSDVHGGIGGAIEAGTGAVLSGATLGLSDQAFADRATRHAREEHPYVTGAGMLAGSLAPALLSGGASAGAEAGIGARILAASPAGLAGKLGGAVSGLGEGAGFAGRLAAATAGAGAEGALYGGGQYLTETALEDKPLSAEGFVAGMGHGALFAAPIGGGLTLASKTLQRARALFPRSEISAASASGVQQQAASSIAQATRDGDQMVAAAERKLSDVEAQTQTAQAGENTTRRVFGEAHPQAMVDQVTGAVDRQQITQALDGYQQARAQLDDWLASESDPELAKALAGMRAPEPGEIGGRIGPAVPTGEFGAPGAGGFKSQDELAQLAMGTDAPGIAPALEAPGTRVMRAKGTPVAPAPAISAPSGFEPPRPASPMSPDEFSGYADKWRAGLKPDETKALETYSRNGTFGLINAPLRTSAGDLSSVPDYLHDTVRTMDKAIESAPAPREIVVTRGVSGRRSTAQWGEVKPGDSIIDHGFGSTSASSKIGRDYAKGLGVRSGVELRVTVPKGFPAAPVPSEIFGSESELLLPRNTKYTVTGIEDAPSGGKIVHVTASAAAEGEASRVAAAESKPPTIGDMNLRQLDERMARLEKRKNELDRPGTRDGDEYRQVRADMESTYERHRAIKRGEVPEPKGAVVHSPSGWRPDSGSPEPEMAAPYGGKYSAAGGVVFNGEGKIAITRPHGGGAREEWALPKGRIDPGETPSQAAMREVLEESGAHGEIHQHIGDYEGEHSNARFYAMRHSGDDLAAMTANGETAEVRFVTPDEAERMLTRPQERKVVADARHMIGEKGRDFWSGAHVRGAKFEHAPSAPDDLLSQLQGTASRLGEGGKFSEIGAAPREAYATDKAARSAEAARHFRAQALEAREAAQPWNAGIPHGKSGSYETSPMAAAEREAQAGAVKQQMTGVVEPGAVPRFDPETKSYFEGPPGAPAHTGGPEDLAKMLGVDLQGMPVSAAGYSARREAMGMPGALERAARKTPEERAIAKAIMRHNGKNVDIGPNLAQGAKIIGDMEEASARLTDVLGAEAPATAVENAAAYRAAIKAQAEASAASAAKAGADVRTRVGPAMDATAVDDDIAKALQRHEMRQSARGADATAVDSDVTKALRAHDMRNPTAATGPAVAGASGGLGSGLADVGSALEVLHAIGAHVPAVSHIPVIGPILGLWLKARAVWGILGRKGGSIGRSTEGSIAAKAAATRERIVAATGAILEGAGKVAGAASHLAGPAVLLAGPLFAGGRKPDSDKPRDLFEARVNDIVRAQSPGAIDQAISQRFPTSDPALHDAIVAQLQRGIGFLDSKRPKQTVLPGVLPGDGTWKPSMAAIDEFAKFVHAVNDPVSVLEDLAKGHPSAEGAETLRAVYPELYAYAQKELLKAAPQMATTLPYSRRVMISILYKIPVDGTMQPSHAQYLQVPAPPAPGPAHPPSATGPLRLGQQTMSPLDARASGA